MTGMETRGQAAAAKTAESAEVTARKAKVIQAKVKFSSSKTKMITATSQIKAALEEFRELKEADPKDRKAAALMVNDSWERLLPGTSEIQKAHDYLTQILTDADPTILEGDIVEQIEKNENEKQKLIDEWNTYRLANKDDINAAIALVEGSNTSVVTQPETESKVIQRRFLPDQSLKPKLLDESSNLLEVNDFIIEFTNYIHSGYNTGEVPAVGHYVQMRNILEHSWIERMDRHDAMKKDLKELCDILHEEAKKKYPKHQRRIHLLKMKKLSNDCLLYTSPSPRDS